MKFLYDFSPRPNGIFMDSNEIHEIYKQWLWKLSFNLGSVGFCSKKKKKLT